MKPNKMKNLLFSVLLCFFSVAAFSQGRTLTVNNNTGCWVYYRVLTGVPGTCTISLASGTIALAPWGSVTYNASSDIPGFPPTPLYHVLSAAVLSGPASCALTPATWQVGEPCTGMPIMALGYTIDPACTSICMQNRITWTSANPPFVGGHAILNFTP